MEFIYQVLIVYVIFLILLSCRNEGFKSCDLASVSDPGIILGANTVKPAGILLPKQKDVAAAYSVSNVVTAPPKLYDIEPPSAPMAITPAPVAHSDSNDFETIPDVRQVIGDGLAGPNLSYQVKYNTGAAVVDPPVNTDLTDNTLAAKVASREQITPAPGTLDSPGLDCAEVSNSKCNPMWTDAALQYCSVDRTDCTQVTGAPI